MKDPRYTQLAEQVVNYSVRVQPGEHVNLRMQDIPDAMIVELIRAVRRAGGVPHVDISHAAVSKELALGATDEQYELVGRYRLQRAEDMQVHICFYADHNSFENADVPGERMQIISRHLKPASDVTCNRRKWTILAWPTPSMAQAAGMSTEEFEDFYFRCCLADYASMKTAMLHLKGLMEATDRVRITGPGTDLSFSIKGIPAIPCCGDCNVPDGEVYTAPIKDSVKAPSPTMPPAYTTAFLSMACASVSRTEKLWRLTATAMKKLCSRFLIPMPAHATSASLLWA